MTFDYHCERCDHNFKAEPGTACPQCSKIRMILPPEEVRHIQEEKSALHNFLASNSGTISMMVKDLQWGSLGELLYNHLVDEKQLPTVWAYEQVCRSDAEKRHKIEALEARIVALQTGTSLEKKLLDSILTAWEKLPPGSHGTDKVFDWLECHIKPAIILAQNMSPKA